MNFASRSSSKEGPGSQGFAVRPVLTSVYEDNESSG